MQFIRNGARRWASLRVMRAVGREVPLAQRAEWRDGANQGDDERAAAGGQAGRSAGVGSNEGFKNHHRTPEACGERHRNIELLRKSQIDFDVQYIFGDM